MTRFSSIVLLLVLSLYVAHCARGAAHAKSNMTIRQVRFVGPSCFTPTQMLAMVKTHIGDDIRQAPLGADKQLLLKKNNENGYVISEVRSCFTPTNGRLTFQLARYRIRRVVISGETRGLSQAQICDMLQLKIGEYFNPIKTGSLTISLNNRLHCKMIGVGVQTKPVQDNHCIVVDLQY